MLHAAFEVLTCCITLHFIFQKSFVLGTGIAGYACMNECFNIWNTLPPNVLEIPEESFCGTHKH